MNNLRKSYLVTSLAAFIFSMAVFISGILNPFELKFYDLLTKFLGSEEKKDNIFIIYIDQNSIEALSKEGIVWPWPRQVYAPVIEYLSEAEAIFLDIIFSEHSSYGVDDDRILSEAIKKAGNVYLPIVLSNREGELNEEDIKKISLSIKGLSKNEYKSIIFPISDFKNVCKGMGNVTILPDEDGVYRRLPLFSNVKEFTVPNFVMSYFLNGVNLQIESDCIKIQGEKIPLNESSLLLKYPKRKNFFPTLSFLEILEASIKKQNNLISKIKKDNFRGKIVFIGFSAAGLFDLKPTPISSSTPGVFIHATAFENLVNKNFIRKVPSYVVLAIIFLISFLMPYLLLRQTSIKINLFVFLIMVLLLLTAVIIFFKFSIYMEFLPSFSAIIFSSLITLFYSYAIVGRERRFIARTFSQYMDKKIVDYLIANPKAIAPGGTKKRVTVFFADIEGFTNISERLSAENTAILLHRVFNVLTEVVINHSGVIDKYIGDSLMAFWGAPLESEFDELNACNAALQSIKRLEELNLYFSEKGLPNIRIRIGIHTGEAIAGNIGSDRLYNYTVIGDTVNTASRLESANKFFKSNIIVSEETYLKISKVFIARPLGIVRVKGRFQPIKIFEILGKATEESRERILFAEKFNYAYSLFREKKWKESREIFENLLKDYPEDFPTKIYLNLIEKYSMVNELTEDWFIVKIESK